MSDWVLEAHDLRMTFGAGPTATHAVDGISLSVAPGQAYGLVGPDGAGKTTTMRLLVGVLSRGSGEVRILGRDLRRDGSAALNHVGYLAQRFSLYEDLTVQENLAFFGTVRSVRGPDMIARSAELLHFVGLSGFEHRLAGQLSGGMKQKLGLACALVHRPRLLLLDEPTTGVDPLSRREFWQILYSLRAEGVAMLISTAYLDEAERCDRLALLHEGAIMHCDTPARLKSRMPGAMLEVVSPDPRRVRDAALPLTGVLGVLLVGNRAHIHVDDAQLRATQIAAALAAAGVASSGIAEVAPTIEDLFVAVLEQQREPA